MCDSHVKLPLYLNLLVSNFDFFLTNFMENVIWDIYISFSLYVLPTLYKSYNIYQVISVSNFL